MIAIGGTNVSKYDDRISNHDINNTFDRFNQVVQQIDNDKLASLSIDAAIEYVKVKRVLNFIKQEFSSCDPLLVSFDNLNAVNAQLQNAINNLSNFCANPDISYISQAVIYMDAALLYTPNFFSIHDQQDFEGLKDFLIDFQKSTGKYLSSVEAKVKGLEDNIRILEKDTNGLAVTVETQKARLDNLMNQASEQITSGERHRNEIINQGEAKRNTDFATAIEDKKKQFETEHDKVKTGFESITSELKSAQKRFENFLEADAEDSLNKIKALLDQAERVTNLVSNVGMAHGYHTYANDEKRTAIFWQGVTIAAFGGLSGFAVYLFFNLHGQDINIPMLILRLLTASTILILGTYSAKQASKHEKLERMYRKTELELTSINPYLACLVEDERHTLMQHFAPKYFGNIDKDIIEDNVKVFDPSELIQQTIAAATRKKPD